MKKKCSVIAALLLLAGCGAKEPVSPARLREDMTLSAIVQEVAQQNDMPPSMTLGTSDLTALLGLREDDLTEGIALIAENEEQGDCLLAAEAAEGKEKAVTKAMQQELRLRREDAAQNHPALTAKAAEGRLITEGRYFFLFILGEGEDPAAESDAIEEIIRGYFVSE